MSSLTTPPAQDQPATPLQTLASDLKDQKKETHTNPHALLHLSQLSLIHYDGDSVVLIVHVSR